MLTIQTIEGEKRDTGVEARAGSTGTGEAELDTD
jgi:hypothetical protein